jgi:hypothetical protein
MMTGSAATQPEPRTIQKWKLVVGDVVSPVTTQRTSWTPAGTKIAAK